MKEELNGKQVDPQLEDWFHTPECQALGKPDDCNCKPIAEDAADEQDEDVPDDELEEIIEDSTKIGESNMVLIKTLVPTSDQLELLCLQPGKNTIKFSANQTKKGSASVAGQIFLWDYQKKIVISDVDGTITKSDVRGHIMPRIGVDWAQKGVVELYNKVHSNGYGVLYLTARALGQASTTRSYLEKLKQDDMNLPEGPVVMSPDGVFKSLNREVIKRKP